MQSRLEREERERMYRFYVTDALHAIGGLNMRYADLIKPEHVEVRTSEQIIGSIKSKLRKVSES